MPFRRVTGGRFVGHAGNTAARKAVWFYPSWKPLARLREQEMLVEIIPSFTTSHSTHSKLVYSSISKAGIPLHTYELSQYLHTPKHHNPIQQSLTAGANSSLRARGHARHWNENVFILMKSSSLAAPKVVKMTTFGAATDENFIKMTTFSFQWMLGGIPASITVRGW